MPLIDTGYGRGSRFCPTIIPNKVGGILTMGGAIVVIFIYPLLNTSILRSGNFRPIYAVVFLAFCC